MSLGSNELKATAMVDFGKFAHSHANSSGSLFATGR